MNLISTQTSENNDSEIEKFKKMQSKIIEIIKSVNIVVLNNNEELLKLQLPIIHKVHDLRLKLGELFGIDPENLDLSFDEKYDLSDENISFTDLDLNSRKYFEVFVKNKGHNIDSKFHKISGNNKGNGIKNSLKVFIKDLNKYPDLLQTINVDIYQLHYTKYFLGGYKDKQTGLEYHHVATQTRYIAKKMPNCEMYSRDTQTYKIRNVSIRNLVDTSTQMSKPGCYISNVTDKLIEPGKYQTADELEAYKLQQIIIIQKYHRRYLAKHRVEKLRQIRQMIIDYELTEQNRKLKDKEKRMNDLLDKRLCPLYNDDFDLLYNALEKWRLKKLNSIDPHLSESEIKAIKYMILNEQHDWLVAINKLKNNALGILNFRAKKNKIIKVSKPLTWKDKFGETIEMDLVETTRGRLVFDIYKSLNNDYYTPEERLDILLTLKRLIMNRTEKIVPELLSLINRECDLIVRNVKMSFLKGLRTRISTLFLILCRNETFNPGVSKYLKVPKNPLDLRGLFQRCRICSNYLENSHFQFSVKSKLLGPCKACLRLFNHSITREELSPYRNILNVLRNSEIECEDYSKMAFIFSEIDMRHLICKIWNSKSVLSSNNDLENLIFVRWIRNKEWSPWNTALMTYNEADAHNKLTDPCLAYDQALLDQIHEKQIVGHNYFNNLEGLGPMINVHNKKDDEMAIELANEEKMVEIQNIRAKR